MMVNVTGSLNSVPPNRNAAHINIVLLFSTVFGMLMTTEVPLLLKVICLAEPKSLYQHHHLWQLIYHNPVRWSCTVRTCTLEGRITHLVHCSNTIAWLNGINCVAKKSKFFEMYLIKVECRTTRFNKRNH